jgi:hypothetical protein
LQNLHGVRVKTLRRGKCERLDARVERSGTCRTSRQRRAFSGPRRAGDRHAAFEGGVGRKTLLRGKL